MENNYVFTVLTPTFKGGKNLYAVYESLLGQTFKNFEWIVVLDGYDSITVSTIEQIVKENKFTVKWFIIEHNHKKAAVNRGVSEAGGEFILIADDDDTFKYDALENLYSAWKNIPASDRNDYVGVTGLCEYEDGSIVGDYFPSDIYDATTIECSLIKRITGEKWGFQRTEIMKKYPFFEDAEGYIGESTVWHEIGKRYKTRYINKVLRTYNQTEGSIMREPYTRNKVLNNCQAYVYGYGYSCGQIGVPVFYNPRFYAACTTNYTRFFLHSVKFGKYKSWMNPFKSGHLLSFSFVIGLVPGFLFFLNDLHQFNKARD